MVNNKGKSGSDALAIYREPPAERILNSLDIPFIFESIPLNSIELSEVSQARKIDRDDHAVDPQLVKQYERDYQNGAIFPPLTVEQFIDDNGTPFYKVIDGNHRHRLFINVQQHMVPAYVVRGVTKLQAKQIGVLANRHGWSLNPKELKAAGVKLVQIGSSYGEAAKIVGLTVKQIQDAFEANGFAERAKVHLDPSLQNNSYFKTDNNQLKIQLNKVDSPASFVKVATLAKDADLTAEELKPIVKHIKTIAAEPEQIEYLETKRQLLEPRITQKSDPHAQKVSKNLDYVSTIQVRFNNSDANDYVPTVCTDMDAHYVKMIGEVREFLAEVLNAFDARSCG